MRRRELDGVLALGHWGRPLLVFPAQEGTRWEWEERGMVDAISGLIEAGLFGVHGAVSSAFFSGSYRPKATDAALKPW